MHIYSYYSQVCTATFDATLYHYWSHIHTALYQDQALSSTSQDPQIITFQSTTTLPMTDHYNAPIDAEALPSRLSLLEDEPQDHSSNNDHEGPVQRRPRSSSLTSSIMLNFTKTSTTSTTDTHSSHSSNLRSSPSSKTHCDSVGVAQGHFSKPRVPARSRRNTQGSIKGMGSQRGEGRGNEKDFKYYGRHSNQWLFNDFSVTDAVSKGFKRVFGKESGKDWYEDRGR
jgi:hypothetical protein